MKFHEMMEKLELGGEAWACTHHILTRVKLTKYGLVHLGIRRLDGTLIHVNLNNLVINGNWTITKISSEDDLKFYDKRYDSTNEKVLIGDEISDDRINDLADKLFMVKPNENISKLLKGEIIIDPSFNNKRNLKRLEELFNQDSSDDSNKD